MKLKITAIVLAVLGSALAVILGIKWMSDYYSVQDQITAFAKFGKAVKSPILQAKLSQLGKLHIASYILVIGGILSIAAVVMMKKTKEKVIYVLAAVPVISGVLAPKSLVLTFLMLIAAVILFLKREELQA